MSGKYNVPTREETEILRRNGIDPANVVVKLRSESSIVLLNHDTRDFIHIMEGDRKWSTYPTPCP